ncbi:hypothetical protein LTR67_005947 [Exophiala xenobiotica]
MPQATLLSYLSKPTATSASSRDHSNANGQTPIHVKASAACLTPPIPSDRLSIINRLEKQSPSIATTIPTPTGPRIQNTKDSESNGTTEMEPACKTLLVDARNGFSNGDTFSQIITIPHLPEAIITPIQQSHLPAIQRLTSTTLPVHYNQSYFTSTLTDERVAQLSRVVLYSSTPVGWIRCRLEPCSPNTDMSVRSQIYIQALALLAPYRSLGLGVILLNAVLSTTAAMSPGMTCIYAHVWEKNEDALVWYAKRGFRRVMFIEQYYRKLRPAGAWIVRMELDGPRSLP